jgi:hypothetical protein
VDFDSLIKDLGKIMNISIKPDKTGVCKLIFGDSIELYIEPTKYKNKILVGSEIGNIPPGAFRTRVLHEALIFNGSPPPRPAVLSYSDKDALVAFQFLNINKLSGQSLLEFINQFLYVIESWSEGLVTGNFPTTATQQQPPGSRPLGL